MSRRLVCLFFCIDWAWILKLHWNNTWWMLNGVYGYAPCFIWKMEIINRLNVSLTTLLSKTKFCQKQGAQRPLKSLRTTNLNSLLEHEFLHKFHYIKSSNLLPNDTTTMIQWFAANLLNNNVPFKLCQNQFPNEFAIQKQTVGVKMAPQRMKNNKHTCKTNIPSNWFRCCLHKLSSEALHLCLMLAAVSKSRYLRVPLTLAQQRLGIVLTGLDNDSAFPFRYTIV